METIANYIIEKTISVNGPSAVYIARHKTLGRKTLLKVYEGQERSVIDRFEREAKIAADLNSDSIVQIYDYGQTEDKFFISIEYVDGQNFSEYLVKEKPDFDTVLDFCFQIASATAVLHRKGYIHRDLKPDNILVSSENKIKLTDFGITLHDSLNRVTSDGALLGTPLYMSPEQINNLNLTTASDVFSLGTIFYQAACGIHPFKAPQFAQVFSRILSETPKPLQEVNPEIPAWFSEMVSSMLIKEWEKRSSTAAEIVKQFVINDDRFAEKALPSGQKPKKNLGGGAILFLFIIIIFSAFYVYRNNFFLKQNAPASADSVLDSTKTTPKIPMQRQDSVIVSPTHRQSNPPPAEQPKPKLRNNDNLNAPTELLIKTFPWCNVYLNYALIDKTPMTKAIPLKPGKYLLSLQNPSYPSFSDSIEIRAHQQNIFTYDLENNFMRLQIHVNPWGRVYIDGKYVGTTPLTEPLYLTKEDHLLEIQNDFYKTYMDSLKWNNNSDIQMSVVLKEKR